MGIEADERVVLTLDAGGTNFVFSAIKGGVEIIEPLRKPAITHRLDHCLETIIDGFHEVENGIKQPYAAISFAFPGPANYVEGIIGDLPNFPCFKGGVPLKAILEFEFKKPVFINNDGDLYAYGEAINGFLPEVNKVLERKGSKKQYKNILAITLGTGLGIGLVVNGNLFVGDNSSGPEIFCTSSRELLSNVEDGVSMRAVKRIYSGLAGISKISCPEPNEIYDIACGKVNGDKEAAKTAFISLGRVLGNSMANLLAFLDGGLLVIGGGLSGAKDIIIPAMLKEMNSGHTSFSGEFVPRLIQNVYYLDDEKQLDEFARGDLIEIMVPNSGKILSYDPVTKIGVGLSKIGANRAISLGAYAFALKNVNETIIV